MEKKYRLLEDDTITVSGRTLYRIEALRDFADVEKGSKGGYIESEDNLSHTGECWVCGDAWVYGDARVYGDACVYGSARVYGDAWVYGNACVYGNANVSGNARVFGDACVYGEARVYDNAMVCGNAKVSGNADYYVGKNVWSSGRYFTYTRSNRMWKVGCFYGTGEELIEKAYKDSKASGREYERVVRYVEAMYADLEKDKSKE